MNLTEPAEEPITHEESLLQGNTLAASRDSPGSSSSQHTVVTLPQLSAKHRLKLTRGSAKLWRNFSRKRSKAHGSKMKMTSSSTSDELFINDSDIILQESVQLCSCFQTQQRYLILLDNVLVITKQSKSLASFHVKDEVRLSEMWLADGIDQMSEVSEVVPDQERSFVMGWPTVNMVATFTSVHVKDMWLDKLQQQITLEKSRNWPQNIVIKVINTGQEFSVTKHMLVENNDTARNILGRCVQEMHIVSDSVNDFHFWVQCDKENHPYPLLGLEYPFAIQVNYLREKQGVNRLTGLTDSLCEGLKFQIVKKQVKSKLSMKLSLDETRTPKKSSRIVKLFQKSSRSVEIGNIFGRDLNDLYHDNMWCPPVMDILTHLYLHGPSTVDIFRKSAIVSKCQEVKQQLDNGDEIDFNNLHVLVSAALLKELLRCLPNCLLLSEFYSKWIAVMAVLKSQQTAFSRIKSLVDLLPSSHRSFLQHLMCILNKISRNSERSGMTAYSLSVCISQTLLWQRSTPGGVGLSQVNDAKKLNAVVERMIESPREIFGDECLRLFDHLEPRWNRERKVPAESSLKEDLSLDIVQEETCFADVKQDFNFTPSSGLESVSTGRSPAADSYDSGLATSNAVSSSDLATPAAVIHRTLPSSCGEDVGKSFSVGSGSSVILDSSERATKCSIGSTSDWFRAALGGDSHFLFGTEFGALSDINSNFPDGVLQQKILDDKILANGENSAVNVVDSSPVVSDAAELAPTEIIGWNDSVQDQNKLSGSSNTLEPVSLEFLSSCTSTFHQKSSALADISKVGSALEANGCPEGSLAKDDVKPAGSSKPVEMKRGQSDGSHEDGGFTKPTLKSNLLRLRRGMTEGGGDIFPKQFVERFHCAFAETDAAAAASGSCFKAKSTNGKNSAAAVEKSKSSVDCSHLVPSLSAALKPFYVQSGGQQRASKTTAPSRPASYHQRQQAAAVRTVSRQTVFSGRHPPSNWQYVASMQCFSNGQRLRPMRPPSYEEAMAEKSRRSSVSGSPSPAAVVFPQMASDMRGQSGSNAASLLSSAAVPRIDLNSIKSPAVNETEPAASSNVDVNVKLDDPTHAVIDDVTRNANDLTLHSQTDDAINARFGWKFARKTPSLGTTEVVNRPTRRTLPDYYSASNAQNRRLDAPSAPIANVQSNISIGSLRSFSLKPYDVPVLSRTDSGDLNDSLSRRQALGHGARRRRQRQHYSDPKLRTCHPVCLGLGRSKSDSCEIIGRKCEGCTRREDKENFTGLNSVLKRKLATMKQAEQNRFCLNTRRTPLSSEFSTEREDVSAADKNELESSYSPKDLKKKRSVVFSCLDDNVDISEKRVFSSKSRPESQNDKKASAVQDNEGFVCIEKSEHGSKDSFTGDSSAERNSQILRSLSAGSVSAQDRLMYVFRSTKGALPDETKVNWSVSKLKQAYGGDNGGAECGAASKSSSRMIPLHDSPYFV